MSGSVAITPDPSFDIGLLVIEAIKHQDDAENFDNDDDILSPPPSPSLNAVGIDPPLLNPIQPTIGTPTYPPPTSDVRTSRSRQATQAEHARRASDESNDKKKKNAKPAHRKKRANASGNASRAARRAKKKEGVDAHHEMRRNAQARYAEKSERVDCDLDVQDIKVAGSGYVSVDDGRSNRRVYSLEELVGEKSKFGFKLQKWDGRTPMALVDSEKRVIGVLAGHPDDENWPLLQAQAADALEARRTRCSIPKPKDKPHRKPRRGPFIALASGVSHGGGQKLPGNLQHGKENEQVLKELNNLKPFKRLAGFASSVMATWAPELHGYYKSTLNCLHCRYPDLARVFPASIFSAVSYNLGPRTVCYRHKDHANLAFGWCAITSLGYFDYTKGGHLVLWDLKLVVEFPPGSTILIPSATIAHSNTSIGKYERRYSFAQYSAGGLFRWVENDYQTREAYISSLSPEQLEVDTEKQARRWKEGVAMYSKVKW